MDIAIRGLLGLPPFATLLLGGLFRILGRSLFFEGSAGFLRFGRRFRFLCHERTLVARGIWGTALRNRFVSDRVQVRWSVRSYKTTRSTTSTACSSSRLPIPKPKVARSIGLPVPDGRS